LKPPRPRVNRRDLLRLHRTARALARPEALADPIRIVRNLHKVSSFNDAEETPYTFIECVQTIYSVEGHNAPLTPGKTIQFEMPDMYGRPWAAIWERYFEEGMSKPDTSEDLFKFDK